MKNAVKSIEKELMSVFERDKQLAIPVIKHIREDFILSFIEKMSSNMIIMVSGESASGKTYKLLSPMLRIFPAYVTSIKGDDFYKPTDHMSFEELVNTGYSFDVPDAVDLEGMKKTLTTLKNGENAWIPLYNKKLGSSKPQGHLIKPKKLILVDSIFGLNPKVRDIVDIGIYIDASYGVMKKRWYHRAKKRHNLPTESCDKLFADVVSKAKEHVIPYKDSADIILDANATRQNVITMLREIASILDKYSFI